VAAAESGVGDRVTRVAPRPMEGEGYRLRAELFRRFTKEAGR